MNTEKINAVADLIEQRTDFPFSMDRCMSCILPYIYLSQTGVWPRAESEIVGRGLQILLLGRDYDRDSAQSIIMPKGWLLEPEQYPRERAVAMLRNLALTGRVEW